MILRLLTRGHRMNISDLFSDHVIVKYYGIFLLMGTIMCTNYYVTEGKDSYSNHEGKFLGPFQKAAVMRAVRNDLNSTGTKVMQSMANVEDGPGNSNTNCSSKVYWRILNEAVLGAAGRQAGGYSQLRMRKI